MTKIPMTVPIATRTLRFERANGSEVDVTVTLGTPVPDPSDPERTLPAHLGAIAREDGGRINDSCRANLGRLA